MFYYNAIKAITPYPIIKRFFPILSDIYLAVKLLK